MNPTRREFVKDGLAALGFLALPGGIFAAPPGWKPKTRPNLVFGILADTHLQSGHDGVKPHPGYPHTYVTNAMKLFQKRNIDAFMHLGDAAHRGKNIEIKYHRDIFEKFFPNGIAPDGHKVEKLLVCGNHELFGNEVGGAGAWGPNVWPDPVERAKHVLCADLPRYWEQTWGEKYEEVWHKEVKGYHFFGRHWETDEAKLAEFVNARAEECSLKGSRPFFILSHRHNHFACNRALKAFPNAVAFFGHWHQSNADYKTIYYDSFGGFFPNIQVGACHMTGNNALDAHEVVTKGEGIRESVQSNGLPWKECKNPSRQAMIVSVYDDKVVFERHEVGQGGRLGPDWVMPLGQYSPHPFKREELARVLGAPEFPKGAKLALASAMARIVEKEDGELVVYRDKAVKDVPAVPVMRVTIPPADANPASRPFSYDVVVVGDDPKNRLFKHIYWPGCNQGMGHEPDLGFTKVDIPKSELPSGKKLTVAVRPVSSLGSKGRAIGEVFKV